MEKTALVLLSRLCLPAKRLLLLLLLSVPLGLLAQNKKITGTVTDESGKGVAGVSVTIGNTNKGTSTNESGQFTITAPVKSMVHFSAVNFGGKAIVVGTASVYNVTLVAKANALLEDVVVIGYGSVKRKDLTGAVGSVNVQDLQKAPVRSFDEALAGRVAGVQVSSVDGQPGSAINIIIRGASSITQETAPLYVIDGFPVIASNFNTNQLDPNDIESIDVLKDAAAVAMYGARGSNGVILITTKRGKNGAPVIAFNTWYGIQKNIKKMQMLGTTDWAQLQLDNTVTQPPIADYNTPGTLIWNHPYNYYTDSTRPVDMQDLLFRTAPMQNYSLGITGGNAQTKYSISGNYLDQNGTIINSGYKRYLGKVTLDQQINTKLKVGIDASYTYTYQYGISPSSVANGAYSGSVMFNILGYRPFAGLSDSAYDAVVGAAIDPNITNSNNYTFNPYINQQHLVRTTGNGNLFANGYLEYVISPKLKFRSTIGINYSNVRSINFNDTLTLYGSSLTAVGAQGANGSVNNSITSVWSNENYITYSNRIQNKHNINVIAGLSEQSYKMSAYSLSNSGLSNPGLGIAGIGQSNIAAATVGESSDNWTTASFYSRASYDYLSRYYFSVSGRVDGSSKFSANNYWAFFPAFSAKWRISEEKFWKNIKPVVSDAGLRLSYGTAGNNRINSFATLSQIKTAIGGQGYTFNVGDPQNNQATGAYVSVLGNADLKWETSKTYNIGLDLAFLQNRIKLTADAYKKNTYDLLYNAPIPTSTGFGSVYKNIGNIQNKGLEITINTTNIITKDFTWSSSFNISFNANKVLKLTNGLNATGVNIGWDNSYASVPAYILKVGQPLGTMYGLKWVGNYQYSDFNKNSAGQYILKDNVTTNQTSRNTTVTGAPQPGDIKFQDMNGDGVINADDYTVIGRATPLHTGGFGNNFAYKNFDLNLFFQWSYGNQIQNTNRMKFEVNASGNNQYASVLNRWTPENQNNVMFRAGTGSPAGPTYYSSRTIEDGSYLRLKTVQLGYTIPKVLLNKWKIKQLRFYASAQNLITWTKYTGFDPEVSSFYSTVSPGFDWGAYPRARTWTFGVNLSL